VAVIAVLALEVPVGIAATDHWTEVGPMGGYGVGMQYNGCVSGLQIVSDGGTGYYVFAGGSGGGLWRSHSSNPLVWTPIGRNLKSPAARAVAVDPSDPDHIVVCSGDPNRYPGGGVFVSQDGGVNWADATLPDVPEAFSRVAFRLGSSQILVAASQLGIMQSFDGGLSWRYAWQGPGNVWEHSATDLRLHPTNALRMYAVAAGVGFLQSLDGGYSWGPVPGSTGLPAAALWGRAALAINRDDPSALAVFIADPAGRLLGIWRSLDNGVSWTNITGDLPDIAQTQASHAEAITFKPGNPDELWVGSISLAHTTDGGTHWVEDQNTPDVDRGHDDINQIVISGIAGDNLVWIANDGGLYRNDTTTKTTIGLFGSGTTGLRLAQIDHVAAQRSLVVIGLQDDGQLKSLDGGTTWSHFHMGDGGAIAITDAENTDFWYWMGGAWHLNRVLNNGTRRYIAVSGSASLHYDRFDKKIYLPDAGVVHTADAYAPEPVTFTDAALPTLHPDPTYSIWKMVGSQADGKSLLFTFRNANRHDVAFALWNGSTWNVHTTIGLVPPDGVNAFGKAVASQVWAMAMSSENPGEAWVGFKAPTGDAKAAHTTDGGATWQDITAELAGVGTVYALAPTPFNPRVVYAGTDEGLYRTTDGGQSWAPYQTGLPAGQVKDIAYVTDSYGGNHHLMAGTYGCGLWSRDVPSRRIIYVDKTNTGGEDGSVERPYKTVAAAVAVAPSGAIVAVRRNTYYEPQTLNRNILLVSWAGSSTIR